MSGGLNGGVTDQSLLFFLYKWATFYSVGSNSFVEIVQSSRRPSVEKKFLKRRYLKTNKVSVVMYYVLWQVVALHFPNTRKFRALSVNNKQCNYLSVLKFYDVVNKLFSTLKSSHKTC